MKRINLLIVVVSVTLLVVGCSGTQSKPTPTPQALIVPAVVSASGKLLPSRWATLSFQATGGGRVVEVKAQAGDQIEVGQVLVRLEDVDAKLALAQANAALKVTQAQLAQTKAGTKPAEIAAAEQGVKEASAAADAVTAQLAQLQAGARAADISAAEAEVVRLAGDVDRAQKAYNGVVAGRAEAKEYGIQAGGLGAAEEQMRAQLASIRAAYDAAQKRLAAAQSAVCGDGGQYHCARGRDALAGTKCAHAWRPGESACGDDRSFRGGRGARDGRSAGQRDVRCHQRQDAAGPRHTHCADVESGSGRCELYRHRRTRSARPGAALGHDGVHRYSGPMTDFKYQISNVKTQAPRGGPWAIK